MYLFADVYHNYNEVVEPILQLFSSITSLLLCYLSEVCAFLHLPELTCIVSRLVLCFIFVHFYQ